MSLDQNLFTLNVTPHPDEPTVIDLIDPKGTVHYRKQRVSGNVYHIDVYDPVSESLLASATAPSATTKHKTIQLHNPDSVVELRYTGTLTFKWSFKWEEHEFEWKREECFILRKPDPSVLVAVTKEPAGRLKTSSVQLLDYNLNRFDIDDRKGLEIVILTALLTFQDSNEASHAPNADGAASSSSVPFSGLLGRSRSVPSTSASLPVSAEMSAGAPPDLPARPPPLSGKEQIAELHTLRMAQGEGEANEVEVSAEGAIDDYALYAEELLQDEAMLFITVRSATAAEVPKVLRVVEETKRLRYKSGLAEEEELFQYVLYDTEKSQPARKGPRIIKLDDPEPKGKSRSGSSSAAYAPPTSLVVHLSKIDMPDLRPRAETHKEQRRSAPDIPPPRPIVPPPPAAPRHDPKDKNEKKHKKAEKLEKERERERQRLEKDYRKTDKKQSPEPSATLKHRKSASAAHIPAHQVHPYQPSPSPAQLNNPAVYAAPPPRHPATHRPSPSVHIPPSQPPTFPSPGGFYAPGMGMQSSGYQPHAPVPMSSPQGYDPNRSNHLGPPPSLVPRPGSAPTSGGSGISDLLHAMSFRH
ncbi:hypothetical protein CERSUDRAFT_92805 [Gelatoporia subvermispora B]|uniref:Uncharacterized protein n=1 Tax=Ceriporiopsis subvermispora (strain B) TaxID=914234 RepID=M2QNY3_CERS8|nr:hypothetical protein CERSUDRAFT_92805 [Gelatoporia subvermispora B]